MQELVQRLTSEKLSATLRVQSTAIKAIHDFMERRGILQVMPILLSPITDPLNHSVFDATVKYYGQELQLTKSITVHKPLMLLSPAVKAIYCMSPNIRLEKKELAGTGRHLIEFTQLEMEFKKKTKHEFMRFVEDLVIEIFARVKKDCEEELSLFKRKLRVPSKPFKVYESKELIARYGEDFEHEASKRATEPFWILDHKREFYDREDKEQRGYYHNYDLVYPEGYGEALSGGEREYEYEEIVRKMKERGMELKPYEKYLAIAKRGYIQSTVGGGLGIERLVRYLTGAKHIDEVTLFPRVPGRSIVL